MANALGAVYKWAVPAGIVAALAQASIYDVKGGTRAVIFDRLSGVKEKVVEEGTHFLVPWLQKSIIYDVRTKPRNISTTTGSKDLQMVSLTLRVLHRPDVQQLPKIYQVCLSLFFLERTCVNYYYSHSVKITTSVSSRRSETRCSKRSLLNSMPPNSSLSERLSRTVFGTTFYFVLKSLTSLSRTFQSHT